MRIGDFELYKDLLARRSGLVLTPDKCYLLDSRLTPIAKKWNYPSLDSMTLALRAVPDPALIKDIVEAMTTNETSFFRDGRPFELFKTVVLPYLTKNRDKKKPLRIWCAAASTGQEPYTLCMTLKENAALMAGWNVEIIATDIADSILAIAKAGRYSQFEVQRGLPIQMLLKYFEQTTDGWQIKPDIRNMVKFQQFNLLDPMEGLGSFDIVFCRNVLIYFDEKTKADVLRRISGRLASDGFLFLGGAETVLGISDAFKPMDQHRGLYVQQNGRYNMEALGKATTG